MNTPSHILINAGFGKYLEKRGIRPRYAALIVGSFMPDVPLTVMSVAYIGWYAATGGTEAASAAAERAFDQYFFNDPVWITAHHLFHAPLLIGVWLFLGWWFGIKQHQLWGRWLLWFAIGNALHTALDIPTHGLDGPLLLFPLNWVVRFQSPVSYWDPAYYGIPFTIFEMLVNLILVAFFVGEWRTRRQRRATRKAEQQNPAIPM